MNRLAQFGSWWARSIRWKMVVVFIAISVIPMLIATDVTTRFVAATFQSNVKAWLFQTSRFFVANIADEQREITIISDTLVEEGNLDKLLSGTSHDLPAAVSQMFDALGYDVLIVFDENDKIAFSSRPVDSLTVVPFTHGQQLYLYRDKGKPILMVAAAYPVVFEGRRFRVLIGTMIDQSFINSMNAMASLAIRFDYKVDGQFVQVYSSQAQDPIAVPPRILTALEATEGERSYVSAEKSSGDSTIGIYAPIRADGELIGFIYCGLSSEAGVVGWLTSRNLFVGIFALGMLLSIGAGLVMSRLLTRPVIRLSQGVNAIAKGDFTQRVPVRREDELGRLAIAFNSMAQQLEGLRKMEVKLRRRERMTTLGEVAAGLAHEVRNPLGIIKTSAELLQTSSNLTDVEARRLGYVVDEVRRIDQLIRDFLAFAKPPQRMADVAPADLIKHVLGICQSQIEHQDVDVHVEDESAGALIHIDLDQMIQACLNLVLNALQAMEVAVEVTGPAPTMARPRLDIDIATQDEEVHLVFKDNGPGLPPHLIERVFDPFVTTKDTGTGLGLARVFAVAEGHGGWVEARNGTHGGAIFELVVPKSAGRGSDVSNDPGR